MPIVATRFTDADVFLFNEGNHFQLYDKMGCHPMSLYGKRGTYFAVWAPNAERVSVVGDFNRWDGKMNPMTPRGMSGIWEVFVARSKPKQRYKFRIWPRGSRKSFDKTDPFGSYFEFSEKHQNAALIWHNTYKWGDGDWMKARAERQARTAPMSIYEVHLGSWSRAEGEDGEPLGYREMAHKLADYVLEMGFTHVELLPVMEHPFYGSWGYQVTGYFAPTSRYGQPQDFMYLIDYLHQQGIGVILDWSPAHFPDDPHGLAKFDGTHLYEHADPKRGIHPDWNSLIFNYGRWEVKSFLISSANFWLDRFHIDGLRVDGVASMLYLDYSRKDGEWVPNEDGSNENREAIAFLKQLNDYLSLEHPDVHIIAEESTAWAKVSRPTSDGGLGFDYKWDMGWMHDTLAYMALDPVHRKGAHDKLTFRPMYTYSENFVLPLSHDEVVHGKGSLVAKMPGDAGQKLANLRLLLGYMYAQPGKKLLFMGGEFAADQEWNHDAVLAWNLLQKEANQGVRQWVADLNKLYRARPALHQRDVVEGGFDWIHADDKDNSVIAFLRQGEEGQAPVLVVLNFTPVQRDGYRVGVPIGGAWNLLLDSDASNYGGGQVSSSDALEATEPGEHGRSHALALTLPPLSCLFLQPDTGDETDGSGDSEAADGNGSAADEAGDA